MTNPRLLTLACLACLLCGPAAPPARGAVDFDEGDLVVSLGDGASVDDLNARYGTRTTGAIRGANVFRLRCSDPEATLARMRRDPVVRGATRDAKVRRHQASTFPLDEPDPLGADGAALFAGQIAEQGRLGDLGVEAARSLAEAGESVVVAVLDTGVDASHPAVAASLWSNAAEAVGAPGADDDGDGYVDDVSGYDFVDDDADPDERGTSGRVVGHGTFIAGLIALAAPRARVMPVRVMNGDGEGSAFDAAAGIEYAVRRGARVVNVSFGTEAGVVPPILKAAIRSASRLGVAVVVAAGNDASPRLPYPASDAHYVLTVGASDGDQPAEFSNFGPSRRRVSLWAPGTELVGPVPGDGPGAGAPRYARWSGTSFATALASAACADLLSFQHVAAPALVRSLLVSSGATMASKKARGARISFADAVLASASDARVFDVRTLVDFDSAPAWGAGGCTLRRVRLASRLVEAVSATAYDLAPRGHYGLYLRAGGDDPWVFAGAAAADAMGSLYLKAWKAAGPGARALLGVDVRQVRAIELRDATGTVMRRATVGPNAPVQAEALFVRGDAVATAPPSYARYWRDSAGLATLMIDVRGVELGRHELWADTVPLAQLVADETDFGGQIVAYFSTDPRRASDLLLLRTMASALPVRLELRGFGGENDGALELSASFDDLLDENAIPNGDLPDR